MELQTTVVTYTGRLPILGKLIIQFIMDPMGIPTIYQLWGNNKADTVRGMSLLTHILFPHLFYQGNNSGAV